MATLKHAISMSYNFEMREADVFFQVSQPINAQELQAYFDDATDGAVRTINVIVDGQPAMTWERAGKTWKQTK